MLGAVLSTTSLIARPPLTFICSGASPEWHLNMAVLLQAVYEQDEKQCLVVYGDMTQKAEERKRLAEQARQYVASEEFTEMCNIVGVDASFLRALSPEKARIAYSRLMDQQLSGLAKTGDADA